jgi:iron(II)-dependent oxidoreductase
MVQVEQRAASAEDLLQALISTRARTLALVAELGDEQLSRVVDPLLSPLIWDLGHIARFEQRWLLEDGAEGQDDTYDPFAHTRAQRSGLSLPTRDECIERMSAVRELVIGRFEQNDPAVIELVIQHEQQHNETMLQLLRQLEGYRPPTALLEQAALSALEPRKGLRAAAARAYRPGARREDWIAFPAGEYRIGAGLGESFAHDNEFGAHSHPIAAFEIAVQPVTAGQYADWIAAGGYEDRTAWSVLGWSWLAAQGQSFSGAPDGWQLEGDTWMHSGFGPLRPVDLSAPVCHINWFEADAFARAHDARLPTEFEWEVGASYDPRVGAAGTARSHPWGDTEWSPGTANLDQLAFGTLPVGSLDQGYGPVDMLGQVWEWTASEFAPYPGFAPFAYVDYSAPFFNAGYRVLRGGSWATRARSVSNHFRNWDRPQRRQLFSGLRLARDIVGFGPA